MGLTGGLDELSFTDLVQMTSVGRKTGRLTLFTGEGAVTGELQFRKGRIVGARCGSLSPEKAFYAMLAQSGGSFGFEKDETLDEAQGASLAVETLLMEGMRRLDETKRLRKRLPAPATVRLVTGTARDPLEARVLGYLGPGARRLGDVVAGLLVGAHADEYDALEAIASLEGRGVIRVEVADECQDPPPPLPQPELEP
jgi:hypothetical protein